VKIHKIRSTYLVCQTVGHQTFGGFRPQQFLGMLTRINAIITFIPQCVKPPSILTSGIAEAGPTLLGVLHSGIGTEALNFGV
jgi:hypothetical protein